MTPPLSTERIIFEPFSPRDLPRLIRFHSDPLVQTGYDPHGKPWSAESIAKRLEAYIAEHQIQGFSRWKMSLIDGEFIGRAGLGWFEKGVSVELGFGLLPKYWGRGYATEAADALVRWGWQRLPIERIVAFTYVGNLPSRKILARIGMKYVDDRKRSENDGICAFFDMLRHDFTGPALSIAK